MSNTIPIVNPNKSQDNSVVNQLTSKPEEKKKNTRVFKLPSQGYFYPEDNALSSGEIELKFVTAQHEDILSNQNYIKKGSVIDEFIKTLIVDPKISIDDLLSGDKDALFVYARILAYGKDYEFKQKCPSCSAENTITVDLENLKFKDINFSEIKKNQTVFQYTTASGTNLVFKLLTHRDGTDVEAELKGLSKLKTALVPEITSRLRKMIISIDGKDDKSYIKNFIEREFPSKESSEFRKYVKSFMPGVQLEYEFSCDSCDFQKTLSIPINLDFYWPDVNV